MIRLAFSTNAFKKNTLDEAIDSIGDIGYAGAELMADLHHAYPPTMDAQRRRQTREHLARRHLPVSNVNAFTLFACGDTYHPTWIEDDAAARELRNEHTIGAIELASDLGAKSVSLQPGGPLIGTPTSRDVAAERFAEGLHQVLPAARDHNITLA